ncbi:Altronate oxidoreductase [Anatilimnocola aggregata]|uniref:Altronate oxidoreductase n=1 Tax=Anatilimnocola aggregata TaxID=2528021 RepID=A0A517YNQ9_9BACT|nr:altronate dehydrogenase [Anatilimnocola aggregata]QDU31858.1 Altronate oxidoreductase [Anatilimnocola aggregata]
MSKGELPETVLQFGAGRFLRSFVDRFIQQANDSGQGVGRIVVVQRSADSRADSLHAQDDGFTVLVRGYEQGELIERREKVHSISRSIVAADDWREVLRVAVASELKYIVSNATEAGYQIDPTDRLTSHPPVSLPGKLTQVLWVRFNHSLRGVTILPCELIERNADKLRALVLEQASIWALPAEFTEWVTTECLWLNNLVDCIVTGPPADHPLATKDSLLTCAEPYALWAIEKPANREALLFAHPAIQLVDDLSVCYLRKVRILNGLHSAMVAKFRHQGFVTVQDVLRDAQATRWIRDLLYEEIVPAIAYRVPGVAAFADDTFDRLRNPHQQHKLADIALNHADKVRVRLQSTHEEYVQLFGKSPVRLAEVIAARV